MTRPPFKTAINPLPWILDARTGFHLDRPSLTDAFEVLPDLGFQAVQADVPDEMTVDEYAEFLTGFALKPAPSYFGADFETDIENVLARARLHAQRQLALGQTVTFVAGNIVPERRARPAVGAAFDVDRLAHVIQGLGQVARLFTDAGLVPAIHPHIGSWIETESEIEAVLSGIPAEVLAFGPDTGHLAWAGVDPVAIIGEHADRVAAMHLKDIDPAAVTTAHSEGADYVRATEGLHVWTEPGRGSVDLDGVLEALPDAFTGWLMLEVDVANLPSAELSSAYCAGWITAHPSITLEIA